MKLKSRILSSYFISQLNSKQASFLQGYTYLSSKSLKNSVIIQICCVKLKNKKGNLSLSRDFQNNSFDNLLAIEASGCRHSKQPEAERFERIW